MVEPENIKNERRRSNDIQRWVITVLLSTLSAGVIGFINFVFITGRYTEKFSTLEARTSVSETNINRMNSEGTYASKSQLRLDEQELSSMRERLKNAELQTSKIPLIEATQFRQENDIKELKTRKGP